MLFQRSIRLQLNYFQDFEMKAMKVECKQTNPLNTV